MNATEIAEVIEALSFTSRIRVLQDAYDVPESEAMGRVLADFDHVLDKDLSAVVKPEGSPYFPAYGTFTKPGHSKATCVVKFDTREELGEFCQLFDPLDEVMPPLGQEWDKIGVIRNKIAQTQLSQKLQANISIPLSRSNYTSDFVAEFPRWEFDLTWQLCYYRDGLPTEHCRVETHNSSYTTVVCDI